MTIGKDIREPADKTDIGELADKELDLVVGGRRSQAILGWINTTLAKVKEHL